MNAFAIKKRDGRIVEIAPDEPLTIDELAAVIGEAPLAAQATGSDDRVLEELVRLVDALRRQGGQKAPTVSVNVPEPKQDGHKETLVQIAELIQAIKNMPAPSVTVKPATAPFTPKIELKPAQDCVVRVTEWNHLGRIQAFKITAE